MFNDKFNKPFVDFLNRNFNPKEHLILCKNFYDFPFPEGKNVIELKYLARLKFDKVQKLICHSLFDNEVVEYLYKHPDILKEKAYWGIWGGDLYEAPRDEKNDFVRANFKGYISDTDTEYACQKYKIEQEKFYKVYLVPAIPLNTILSIPKIQHDYIQIQINNSCDKSTLEMLDILSKFKNENIKITTILSYGQMEYKDKIIKKGQEIFGDKFEFLDTYLSLTDYVKHLAQNDILILNQNRQQGLGNITMSAVLGTKIYVRKECTTYNRLKNDNVPVFDTNDICSSSFNDFIFNDSNSSEARKYFDENIIKNQLKELFDAK